MLGDTGRRRALILTGGVAFALSAALTAGSTGFWLLLGALVIGNPASTAFVSFAQAALMDLEPDVRERNMARWTLAGSVGLVAGPLVLAGAIAAGVGWRGVSVVLAVAALLLTLAARRAPIAGPAAPASFVDGLRGALSALRRRAVLRWLALLEASDLLLDVLHGFLALYFVDVAGFRPVEAGLAIAVWTGASLAGDALLLPVLARGDGLAFLRASAVVVGVAYCGFLAAPGPGAKLALIAVVGLATAGWYAIPKARLYGELPGRSGTAIAVGSVGGLVGALIPLAAGVAAAEIGLGATMWLLLAGPIALVVGLPRRRG